MAGRRTLPHLHQRGWRRLTAAAVSVVVIALVGMLALWYGASNGSVGYGASNASVGYGAANAGGSPPIHPSEAELLAGGPSTYATAGGLTLSVQISPSPYFIGELIAVEMTLVNHSQTAYPVQGIPAASDCDQAIGIALSGGGEPRYTLPTGGFVSCPFTSRTLSPGQTWTIDDFVPLTASGEVTLTASARFMVTATATNGAKHMTAGTGPFAGHWPMLHLSVAPTVPTDRVILLRQFRESVTVIAPRAAQSRLFSINDVTCRSGNQDTTEAPRLIWQPVGTTLTRPGCPGDQGVWTYSVGAPGYAIASGKYPANG